MPRFNQCQVCDIYFDTLHATSAYPDICDECTLRDQLRVPLLILRRVREKGNTNCLSRFEMFELWHSRVLDTLNPHDTFIKRLKRKLRRRFEYI